MADKTPMTKDGMTVYVKPEDVQAFEDAGYKPKSQDKDKAESKDKDEPKSQDKAEK